jgi:hypothetical protein
MQSVDNSFFYVISNRTDKPGLTSIWADLAQMNWKLQKNNFPPAIRTRKAHLP